MMSAEKLKLPIRHGAMVVLCILIMPAAALAQQYYDPGLLQKTIDRKPVDYQTPGARIGSFILKPGAEFSWEDNNNIFYRSNRKISDDIIHIRPWVTLDSDWNRHELNLSVYGDIGRYDSYGSEDYEDWMVKLDGRIDVRRGSYFSYVASNMQLHEDRSSPDDVHGVSPTEFTYTHYGAGYRHTFNRMTAALDVETVETDYDNNRDGDGHVLNNQDRDRSRDALKLEVGYEVSTGRSFFISAEANKLDYDEKFDNNGFQRSSDGYAYRGGMRWDMTGLLEGGLYVKYFKQRYDDTRFEQVDGFGLGGSLDWSPTRLTNVHFRFDRGPQETTQAQTSGYDSALYAVRVQQELRRNLLANLRFSYTDNNYQFNGNNANSLSDTQVTRAGFGLSYLVNRHIFVSGGYAYEKQDANTAFFDYKTNRWFVTIGLEL